jgi:hypothetical protein
MNKGVTTAITSVFDDMDKVMTGEEIYPVYGELLTTSELIALIKKCRGLYSYWDCVRKAYIVKKYLNRGVIVAGECMVQSANKRSLYGHYFRPPFEFHAWWQEAFDPAIKCLRYPIIDIALPGLITKGLITKDEIGPMLTGREPVILAGNPEQWMYYTPEIEIRNTKDGKEKEKWKNM